jgi:anti-sigma B factor antagonist
MNSILTIKDKKDFKIASFSDVNRFNALVSQAVKEEINSYLVVSGTKLIFDLSGIRFIDSSAFGALISNLKTAKQNNTSFSLCNLAPEIKDIITVMQLDTIFTIGESIEDCMK